MRKRAIALGAAVLLLVGGAIGWILASGREPAEPGTALPPPEARRAVEREGSAPRLGGDAATPEANAERIARLEEEVARLRTAIAEGRPEAALDPEVRKGQVLERLQSIEHGEQQVAVQDLVHDLAEIGDPVVADLVALLRSGADRDWGGGFSTGGNAVKSYGRMRMALIDALRQIGTAEAKAGLLAVVGESQDLTDFRDLLLLYGATTDPVMIEGISALVPGVLQRIAEEGVARVSERSFGLIHLLVRWIRGHPMAELAGPVAAIVERAPPDADPFGRLFGLLVELDPPRAVAVARARYEADPAHASVSLLLPFGGVTEIPLAKLTRYLELLFGALDLDATQRRGLYMSLHAYPCRSIEDAEARIADARVLLEWLQARRRLETDKHAALALDRAIESLDQAIRRLEPGER